MLTTDLDFPSWDAYPTPGEAAHHDLWRDGMDCDRIRGLGDGRLWIMETEPGHVNWQPMSRSLEPGQTRALAWHFAGHGADAVLYWQWRSAPCNQEQHHGALCDQAGRPRPVAAEIARTAAEFRACAAGLAGSRPAPRVAVVDRWLDRTFARRFPLQRLHGEDDGTAHALAHHRALRRRGEDVAVRDRLGDLGGLRLIVAPRWTHLDDGDAAALREWVLAGGHLLLGARSGSKDRHGAFHDHRQPGPVLAPLLGAEVEDLHVLTAGIPVAGAVAGCGLRVGERLLVTAADAEVAARWGDGHGWLAGTPALVTRRAGRGRISYLGAQPDDTLADAVAVWALAGAGITTPAADAAVEWCRRIAADGRTITIAVNTGAAPAPAADPAGARALVDDRRAGVLPAWGVAVWAAVG